MREVHPDIYDVLHAYYFNVVCFERSLRATSCDFGVNNTLYGPYQLVSNAYDMEESANDLLKYAPEFGGAEGNPE
jgi:hypothetical protein